jgi:hypothetical protein
LALGLKQWLRAWEAHAGASRRPEEIAPLERSADMATGEES